MFQFRLRFEVPRGGSRRGASRHFDALASGQVGEQAFQGGWRFLLIDLQLQFGQA